MFIHTVLVTSFVLLHIYSLYMSFAFNKIVAVHRQDSIRTCKLHAVLAVHCNYIIFVLVSIYYLYPHSTSPHLWFEHMLRLIRVSQHRVSLTARYQVKLHRLLLVNKRLLLATLHIAQSGTWLTATVSSVYRN